MKKSLNIVIQEAVRKVWTEGVSSLKKREEEMVHGLQSLKKRVDFQQSSEEIQTTLTELGHKLHQSSEALEKKLESNVHTVIFSVKDPLMEELNRLKSRAEQVSNRIEAQFRRSEKNRATKKKADKENQSG